MWNRPSSVYEHHYSPLSSHTSHFFLRDLRCSLPIVQKLVPVFPNFCFTRTLLPVTRDESGVRGQNVARAGAKVSSTTYRDTEPPAYNLHASPQPRARRTHPTRNIRNGPTKRLESRNKAFPLDNMGSPPHVKLEPVCALGRAAAATQLLST